MMFFIAFVCQSGFEVLVLEDVAAVPERQTYFGEVPI